MKNNRKNITGYKGLSGDEIYLISRAEFEKRKLITTGFSRKLFKDIRKASNILDRLKRKGRLIQIERGKYLMVPIPAPNQLWTPNEFVTAKYWMGEIPYYIGYFTMYNYWGFTEQMPQTIFVLNTKRSCAKKIGDLQYKAVKINKNKYYGIKKIRINGETVRISDKERTLVDFAYKPVGSFDDLYNVLEEHLDKNNIDKFLGYLARFPVISVRRRVGYILEKLDYKRSKLQKLRKSISGKNTFAVLNPWNPSRKGKIDKYWGVIVNE